MRRLRIAAGVLGALAVLAAVTWIVVVPWWVRKRIVEEANARGVQLTLGGLSIGWSSATVSGVTATAEKVPGVTVTAGRIDVALERFQPTAVSIANASIDIDGKAGDVATAIDKFLSSQPSAAGPAAKAPSIALQNARLEWRRALGENTALHVGDLGGDVKGDPLGSDVKLHFAGITVDIGAAGIGPWTGTLDRDTEKSEVGVVMSTKGVAKARVTHLIGSDGFTADVDVEQPMSFVDLGFSKAILGLVGLEEGVILVDATHGEEKGVGHGSVRKLRLQGFRLARAKAPAILDVVDLAYAGPLAKMTITKGRVSVGPLSGPVDGFIGRPESAVTIRAHTKTDVMSCNDAIKSQTSGLIGSPAAGVLDTVTGVLGLDQHVQGTVTADATWAFDSRDPAATSLLVTPTATCDLSFLPK